MGVLTRDEAIARGCSGPVARASGVARDLRKDEPYLNYGDFDFDVCCAEEGDCYARYLVRLAEIRESMKIVHQAVENLPPGPVSAAAAALSFDEENCPVVPDGSVPPRPHESCCPTGRRSRRPSRA